MGTLNEPLLNIANYEDKAQLKNLIRNFRNLQKLMECGDSVAAAIYVDLKGALTYLNERQGRCVQDVLIDHVPAVLLAAELNRDEASIRSSIDAAMRSLQRVLLGGDLYEREDVEYIPPDKVHATVVGHTAEVTLREGKDRG